MMPYVGTYDFSTRPPIRIVIGKTPILAGMWEKSHLSLISSVLPCHVNSNVSKKAETVADWS